MTPKAAPTWRRAVVGVLPVAVGVLSLCLLGDCQAARTSRALGSVLGEITAALSDAGTQWMVFVCAGVYLLAFLVLRRRVAGIRRTGTRWNASLPGEAWLLGLLAMAATAYGFGYGEAVKSTQALTLLGGAMIGQGVAFWESRKQKVESRNGDTENIKQKAESRNEGSGIVLALIVLLTVAAVWQGETGHVFQYRGEGRWSGPWDNPNTFGVLMGVGVVLALGMMKEEGRRKKEEGSREHPTSDAEHPTSNAGIWRWATTVFFICAAGAMSWGLLKSYSRGAWVGTAVGVAYLAAKAQRRKQKAEIPGLLRWGGRQWVSLAIIIASLGVLAFWGFRETEWRVARRAFSIGNVNDFSWRNRVSAYEGALRMMADKPWFGFGWNQADRVYEQLYRKPQVAEGAAIQLDDYFTLGTTLGLPALVCFVMYVGLGLTRPLITDYRSLITDCGPRTTGEGPRTTDYRPLTSDYCLKTTCRAGAVVLLVGFWFDGGLFKLATAAPFWILLELGREGNHEIHERHERVEEDRGLHGLRGLWEGKGRRFIRVFRVFRGSFQLSASCFLLFLLGGALLWAKGRDPFRRVEFTLKMASGGRAKGMAILPKPVGRHPVVIYLHGAGGSLLGTGNELRQVAEVGLAAVGLEYCQTNYSVFEEQFTALHRYLQRQPWAESNATAWVGYSLGAQRTLSFALRHPEIQPQLLVRRAGGWVEELKSEVRNPKSEGRMWEAEGGGQRAEVGDQRSEVGGQSSEVRPSTLNHQLSTLHCKALLIHGERDEVFPVADCKRPAERLRANGTPVEVRIFPEMGHGFGEDTGPVVRALAEYCAAHLPLADYWSEARGQRAEVGGQSAEAARFNLAMQRAGQHRRELWRAVQGFGEPERHTVMAVIGGLEDYDLAHLSAAQLREDVKSAWRTRRRSPWCRDTPLEVFERFVANRRIYEEPRPAWVLPILRHSLPKVKYCRDTAEASDAVGAWLYNRLGFRTAPPAPESSMEQLLAQSGMCREGAMAYTYLGRRVGLAMRPVHVIWPTLGADHWYTEVWSTEEDQWHAVDSADPKRSYRSAWVLRVPKASALSTTGERGGWNALAEGRWEALTNTVGLFYPSGQVLVRVVKGDQPARDQRVIAQIWLHKGVLSVAAARTDANGEAQLTLGQSAVHPYRLSLDNPGEPDWEWLAVQSNRTYTVTLSVEKTKPFDQSQAPSPLGFPQWERRPAP